MVELHSQVFGRVQLVMYRDFVQRKASKLGLCGYVKNLDDGSVSIVAQGDRGALDELVKYLNHGSVLSRVEKVVVEWLEPSVLYSDFRILY